ncbi:MAG TPA: cupin domain-containing protein [Steroidobacteraceae bacterium]|nr:cupin domain-containing protein [Steroidobacteraceae bacterium]
MNPDARASTDVCPECSVLAADRGLHEPSGTRGIRGEHFDIEFVRIARGGTVGRSPGMGAGEEVATVLEGTLHVESGDERYLLSAGEGIVIPPGQGSWWSAPDASGLLYRVIVRADAAVAP